MTTEKVRERILAYKARHEIRDVAHDGVTAIVKVPVEMGLDKFIPVDQLPAYEEVTNKYIPDRMRDFAFRYATEYKPIRVWSDVYGVSANTISKWLSREDVRQLITLTRYERRSYLMGALLQVERRLYKKLNEILAITITTDNMPTVLKAIEFAHKITSAPEDLGSREKGTLNVNVGVGVNTGRGGNGQMRQVTPEQGNPHVRNVTPEATDETIEATENRISQLKDLLRKTDGSDEGDTLISVDEE